MLNSDKLCIENIVNQTRSSEKKFREGNFKGATEEKKVRMLLNSKFCDEDIIKKFKEELFFLHQSKFDLINYRKLKIDVLKINKIIRTKSEEYIITEILKDLKEH